MKSFEELMRNIRDLKEKSEEEITDEEIDKEMETMGIRAGVFIRVHEERDKEQRFFMSRLSLKLNNLFKAGCTPKQLIKAFNSELKELWKKIEGE